TAFWMMFFDGYIGAPPTVTVCSFCASVGVAATAPKASAAAVSNKAVREAFMWVLHSVLAVRPAGGLRMEIRMTRVMDAEEMQQEERDHRLVSLPAAIPGPVGRPVGEPPGGSTETASVASEVRRPVRSRGTSSRIGCPGWISPSEWGRVSPAGISH